MQAKRSYPSIHDMLAMPLDVFIDTFGFTPDDTLDKYWFALTKSRVNDNLRAGMLAGITITPDLTRVNMDLSDTPDGIYRRIIMAKDTPIYRDGTVLQNALSDLTIWAYKAHNSDLWIFTICNCYYTVIDTLVTVVNPRYRVVLENLHKVA